MDSSISQPSDSQPQKTWRQWHRFEYLGNLMRRFSPSERLALYIFTSLLALSVFLLVIAVSESLLLSVPKNAGSLTEGQVGSVRFVNPILAISGPDRDMTQLVYSGLMRATPDGTIIPDLAENYTISEDGSVYTFTLRRNATFHDGKPVTSEDIVFTVKAALNTALKSPRQADWVGVDITTPDAQTVVFKLPHAYAPFIEDTTMGILPKHLWKDVSDQDFAYHNLNTRPIGSGPYMIANAQEDDAGSIRQYDLVPFTNFTLGRPHIATISIRFYPNSTALKNAFTSGEIEAYAGIDPNDVATIMSTHSDRKILSAILPRDFGVFLNQTRSPSLADLSARQALDAAIDKQALVNNVLHGFGAVLDGPIPPGIFGTITPAEPTNWNASKQVSTTTPDSTYAENARNILKKGGWTFNESTNQWEKGKLTLTFTLSTADEPELVATARQIAADWSAAGINAQIRIYPISDFNTSVLRPRDYDAILFGQVIGRTADFFAFWDSSQRNDPGLNLSMYANSQASSLLAKGRSTTDRKTREALYTQFSDIIKKDTPAIFLYSPAFIYILPSSLHGIAVGAITTPAERFLNVYQWYTQTERVWSVFAQGETQNSNSIIQ